MGSDLNLPKALTQLSPPPPPPQPLSSQKSNNMPMLYYGLVVVATAAIVLAVYNLLIVRWCTNQYQRRQREELVANNINFRSRASRNNNHNPQSSSTSDLSPTTIIIGTSIRYKKGLEDEEADEYTSKLAQQQLDDEYTANTTECSVCLSGFEEGEQVKKLPRCNHWFHAACIDMWLFSHPDCPLCRAPVVVDPRPRRP